MSQPRKTVSLLARTGTAACAVLLLQCVYFNTFYNAKVSYKTARKAHSKLLRINPDSTFDLPRDIQSGYDTAVSKSMKVLQVHHKRKKWHDDAIFLVARAFFHKGENTKAIRRFRQLIEDFPVSPFVPESYLYLGKAYLRADRLADAEETFALVLDRYPHLNKEEEVSFLLAQVAIKREGTALAIELLEKVKQSVKNEYKRMQLFLQIAELYIEVRQYNKAISLLKSCPRKKDAPTLLFKIDFSLAICYAAQDSMELALSVTDAMLKDRTYTKYLPRILLKKGRILNAMGRHDEALETLERVTDEFESDSLACNAWFELAQIHQRKEGDFEKARECYQKAGSKCSDKQMKETANIRVKAIDLLMPGWDAPDTVEAEDTTQVADTSVKRDTTSFSLSHYRIGEIFWLNLDEPDSAFRHYMLMATDTLVDKDSLAKAFYVAGWLSRNILNDSIVSDSILSSLIDRYPGTEYAKSAQRVLGEPVTIRTREDSAYERFTEAERVLLEDGETQMAIEGYLGVYDDFPDQFHGRKALYAAAWLNDHVLERNRTAYDLYRKLCKEHPKSELCLSEGEPRLKIVADTLRVRKARKKAEERALKRGDGAERDSQTVDSPPTKRRPSRGVGGASPTPRVSNPPDSAGITKDGRESDPRDERTRNRYLDRRRREGPEGH